MAFADPPSCQPFQIESKQLQGFWGRWARDHRAAWLVGLPLVAIALAAMLLSDSAQWAQVLAAFAIVTFLALNAVCNLRMVRRLQQEQPRKASRRENLFGGAIGLVFGVAIILAVGFIASRVV